GEAFAHPLVAIAVEADCLPPPLVRDFVCGDNLPERGIAIEYADLVLNGAVPEVADGKVDEHGPALPVVAIVLLRERDMVVLQRTVQLGVNLDCDFAF